MTTTAPTTPAGRRRPSIRTSTSHRSWSSTVFRLVDQGHVRRRPSDIVRVVGAVVGAGTLAAVAARAGPVEQSIYQLLLDIPDAVGGLFRTLSATLLVAVVVVIVGALLLRRFRLAGTMTLAGGLAGTLALVGADLFGIESARQAAGITMTDGSIPSFPADRLAAMSAVLLAGAPYLTRPMRRVVHVVIPLGMLGVVFLAQGLPTDVLGAVVLGWGSAALAHLAFGSPAGTPTVHAVERALATLGVTASEVRPAEEQSWGATRFVAVDGEGRELAIEVLGRDATDAQLFAKLGRFLWYKDSSGSPTLTRLQRVEHEAYLLLLTERAELLVPEILGAGIAGPSDEAVLVTRPPQGPSLASLSDEELTDDVLDAAWDTTERLHAERITHGDLRLENLVLTGTGAVGLRDFRRAASTPSIERRRLDHLGLLVATASRVGIERSLAAGQRSLGDDGLVALLPLLQPATMSDALRHRPEGYKNLVKELRSQALELTGVPEPEMVELRRVSPTDLLMAAATILGIYLLFQELSSVDDLWATLTSANPAWVVVVIFCSQMPQVTGSVTIIGAVDKPLPFGRVVIMQFAQGFTGLVGGTVANTALVVRFFQKHGLGPAVALSSGLLWSVAGFITQVVLIIVCVLLVAPDLSDVQLGSGDGPPWLAYLLLAGAVIGMALVVPRVRRTLIDKLRPQVELVWDNLRTIASSPRKAVELFGGAFGSQMFYAFSLDAAVHAYGGTISLPQVILTNSFASLVGGMAPIPGGMGVTEAGMVAGLTAAGVPQTTAMAATLLHRTFTYYLPPTWGWVAFRWLGKHDDI